MHILPNLLSFLRIPLAFVFLDDNPLLRSIAIFLAMATDVLDGYLARHYKQTSRLGFILDPLADKFFVLFVLGTFIYGQQLTFWESISFFSRDIAAFIFGSYLLITQKIFDYQFPPFWCGKISTALQLACLLALTLNLSVPAYVYWTFVALGIASLFELLSKQPVSA